MPEEIKKIEGVLAEFGNPKELLEAAEKVRDAGYKRFDCHTPFPVHGMDAAMGLGPSRLGWLVAAMGFAGTLTALAMQWWMSAVDYPVVISGKPLFSFQAFIPIIFEVTILFSAFATVIGMLGFNILPRFHHPVFYSDRIRKATDDGFFLSIESTDPFFREDKTKELLTAIGGQEVEYLVAND